MKRQLLAAQLVAVPLASFGLVSRLSHTPQSPSCDRLRGCGGCSLSAFRPPTLPPGGSGAHRYRDPAAQQPDCGSLRSVVSLQPLGCKAQINLWADGFKAREIATWLAALGLRSSPSRRLSDRWTHRPHTQPAAGLAQRQHAGVVDGRRRHRFHRAGWIPRIASRSLGHRAFGSLTTCSTAPRCLAFCNSCIAPIPPTTLATSRHRPHPDLRSPFRTVSPVT